VKRPICESPTAQMRSILPTSNKQANARASRARRFAVCIPKALNAQLAGTASHDGIAWFSVGVDKL